MTPATKLYAETVRYWYHVNKNVKSNENEPKLACPGLAISKPAEVDFVAASYYVLDTLLRSEAAGQIK